MEENTMKWVKIKKNLEHYSAFRSELIAIDNALKSSTDSHTDNIMFAS